MAFGFDIDDFDRGNEARNAEDYVTAYEIFYDGCEQKDELSCEALGDMFINEEINDQMDGDLKKHSNIDLAVRYFMKSCDLGYQNACDDVINLKDDLNLTFDIDVYPQFELGNYKGLEAEKKSFEMTDDLLNEELEIMVRKHAKLEEVEDPAYKAQLDDTVDLAFEGFMDGVPFPGGKAESHLLKLGSKSFIDNFEEQLVGYTKGQEGEITVKFPEEYHAPELAGKPAQFKVKINAIKKLRQPELNDDFAKELGYASLDELKAKTKEETIKRENDRIENEYVSALLDKLMETTTIDVPVSMVQAEIQNRLKELEYQLSMQGFKMDDYLKMMGGNVETFAAQLAPAAEKKVKVDLILDRIAKENNFEATDAELNERLEEVAKMYGMDVPTLEEELKKNNNLDNFKASVKYDIVMKKAIDEVVKNAK